MYSNFGLEFFCLNSRFLAALVRSSKFRCKLMALIVIVFQSLTEVPNAIVSASCDSSLCPQPLHLQSQLEFMFVRLPYIRLTHRTLLQTHAGHCQRKIPLLEALLAEQMPAFGHKHPVQWILITDATVRIVDFCHF